ncbi:DUF58 domain-containing protein [Myxococcota bacterium]|nr:DUF58 domain-containing protein [Myxococcota bacterium]MBU1534372.1 DUF58 domain-containing protein [Myxococcota bacterium]
MASKIVTRKIALTLPGIFLLSLDLFLFVVAFLLGNLGLLLISSLFAAMVILSAVIGLWTVSGLEPIRKTPLSIVRFSPYLFSVGLKNTHGFFAVYSLKIKDVINGMVVDKPCYFFKIPPTSSQTTFYRHAFVNRGKATFDGLFVSTAFPFSLVKITRFFPLPEEHFILPETIDPPPARHPDTLTRLMEMDYSLRPYRPGDHPRFIHWPQSIRTRQLVTRNENRSSVQPIWLQLENSLTPHSEGGYIRSQDSFELLVSHAAGMAHILLKKGLEVGILTRGGHLPPVAGVENLDSILQFLSRVNHYEGPFPQLSPREIVISLTLEDVSEAERYAF